MSCPNARKQFPDCSMLSGLDAWQSSAVIRARKHATHRSVMSKFGNQESQGRTSISTVGAFAAAWFLMP